MTDCSLKRSLYDSPFPSPLLLSSVVLLWAGGIRLLERVRSSLCQLFTLAASLPPLACCQASPPTQKKKKKNRRVETEQKYWAVRKQLIPLLYTNTEVESSLLGGRYVSDHFKWLFQPPLSFLTLEMYCLLLHKYLKYCSRNGTCSVMFVYMDTVMWA